jgi:hypothetical protein
VTSRTRHVTGSGKGSPKPCLGWNVSGRLARKWPFVGAETDLSGVSSARVGNVGALVPANAPKGPNFTRVGNSRGGFSELMRPA